MISERDSVLVVVDMQNGFLNEKSRHIIPNVELLVRECRRLSIPVVFTRFFNRPGSPFERLIDWNEMYSPPDTDLADELQPDAETVVDKYFYTSFTTKMLELIEANSWRRMIVCGVTTESCVTKTAVDAFERGMVPLVVSDACASNAGEKYHQAGLLVLEMFIGIKQILSTQEILRQLVARSE